MLKQAVAAAIILSAASTAYAVQAYDNEGRPNPDAFEWTGVALGGHFGTLGLGGDATFHLNPRLHFRVSGSVLPFDYKDDIDDIRFDIAINYTTVRFLFDYYPSSYGAFRISGGLVYADNFIDVSATPFDSQEIGDNTYTPQEIGTISGSLLFDEWSPYIGIGFGNPVRPDSALTATLDIGIMFQSYETEISANGSLSGSPAFESDLDKLEQDIDDALDSFKLYPVVMFGLSYQF